MRHDNESMHFEVHSLPDDLHLQRVDERPVLQLERWHPCAPNTLLPAAASLKLIRLSCGTADTSINDSEHGENSARVYLFLRTPVTVPERRRSCNKR